MLLRARPTRGQLLQTTQARGGGGIPEGNIAKLRPLDRGRLAEHIQLVATGSKKDPCFTVIDAGEGQRPRDFPATFCSLVRSNKLRVPFVQGKFNMGGCGTLPFCGKLSMQLVISRRNPALVPAGVSGEEAGWGFTLMRRKDPAGSRRSSSFEYLAPGGRVMWFEAASIPARPSRERAYEQPLEWGTLVKLFNYQIEHRTAVVFDLNFALSRMLYQLALPIRLSERRDYRGHSRDTILTGLSVRLQDDRAGVLEDGFPDGGVASVEGVGEVPVEAVVCRRGEGRNFISPHAAVLFTVNGQVHGGLGRRFLTREAVRLDFLKNDLMVVVNCTDIPPRVRELLFMPSRDRLRECEEKAAFERALELYLRDHEELRRLNLRRRDEELRGRLADDRPLTEALRNVIDSSPELRQLFGQGVALPNPAAPGDDPAPFAGVKFPTFFRPAHVAEGEEVVVDCPQGAEVRVRFETDAANDYFTRTDDSGTVTVAPAELFSRILLRDGRAALVLRFPEGCRVGRVIPIAVEVTDPSRVEPFRHLLKLRIVPPREVGEPNEPRDRPKVAALALPKIVEVDEACWGDEGFTAESGLAPCSGTWTAASLRR